MNNYHLKKSFKTKVLNQGRKIFTIPLFEKFLVKRTLNNSSRLWKKLIPPDYLYKKGSFRLINRHGINYKLDISNVVDHYLYYGFKETGYDSILNELKNAAVILDIGANIGITALYYASINSKAQILAFEPHPESFKRAEENVKLNSFKNINLFNIGLGEKKDTLKLYEVNEHNPGMNRIMAGEKNLPFSKVDIDLLDVIMAEKNITRVDFIKIDVEGFEYSVLKGGKKTIQASKPILFIELDDNNLKENNSKAKEVIELLATCGYNEFYRADNLTSINIHSEFDNCHYDLIAR